jgi:hypothetical protein
MMNADLIELYVVVKLTLKYKFNKYEIGEKLIIGLAVDV